MSVQPGQTDSESQGPVDPMAPLITREFLARYFHMPISQAAKELGVCTTMLKKMCRKNGVPRWPFRKIHSLDRMIMNMEHTLRSSQEDPAVARELAILRARRTQIISNPEACSRKSGKGRSRSSSSSRSPSPNCHRGRSRSRSRDEDSDSSRSRSRSASSDEHSSLSKKASSRECPAMAPSVSAPVAPSSATQPASRLSSSPSPLICSCSSAQPSSSPCARPQSATLCVPQHVQQQMFCVSPVSVPQMMPQQMMFRDFSAGLVPFPELKSEDRFLPPPPTMLRMAGIPGAYPVVPMTGFPSPSPVSPTASCGFRVFSPTPVTNLSSSPAPQAVAQAPLPSLTLPPLSVDPSSRFMLPPPFASRFPF